MKHTLLFVGLLGSKGVCGETMKNHLFVNRFKEIYDDVLVFDAKGVRHRPWKLLKLVYLCVTHRNINIIISASPGIGRVLLRFIFCCGCKNVNYWMVGGSFHLHVREEGYDSFLFRKCKCILVQSPKMVESLLEVGFKNVVFVPNSKPIDYLPDISKRDSDKINFVFLSRIHPDKGCNEIIQSVLRLNSMGYSSSFSVDFYGKVESDYDFIGSIDSVPNVSYKGFLDLTSKAGYDTLAKYNMMLFPTYWEGEGFPGIIIDAYIAGLPVIASDWNFNTDFIDSTTGIIIKPHDVNDLMSQMEAVILGKYDLDLMSFKSQSKAMAYNNKNVITKELLSTLTIY